jgi:Zn-dependent peptidase ImmA (M78 family)
LAEALGVEVKFWPVASMEGMYVKGEPGVITISSERPWGRRAFTCAHELGHHVFGHGTRVDEYLAQGQRPDDPEEWLADHFAGSLLMPRAAVERAFQLRGWEAGSCTPLQAFVVSGQLGVGYTTLAQHLLWSLKMISVSQAEQLQKISLAQFRRELLGEDSTTRLLLVDRFWGSVAIDLQVGEQAILPRGVQVEQKVVSVLREVDAGLLVQGRLSGTEQTRVPETPWSAFIRVSRARYVGRSMFRHMEDPDDNG